MINENITIAIIATVAPTLAVIGSTIVSLRTTREQVKRQNIKLDQIHVLTNENFSKALAKIDKLEAIIKEKENNE